MPESFRLGWSKLSFLGGLFPFPIIRFLISLKCQWSNTKSMIYLLQPLIWLIYTSIPACRSKFKRYFSGKLALTINWYRLFSIGQVFLLESSSSHAWFDLPILIQRLHTQLLGSMSLGASISKLCPIFYQTISFLDSWNLFRPEQDELCFCCIPNKAPLYAVSYLFI